MIGPTARSNREGIEAIINQTPDWERRSGATVEAEKTAIIHFAPKTYKWNRSLLPSKDKPLSPKGRPRKILGVLMDTRLKYKEPIAMAATNPRRITARYERRGEEK